MENIEKLNPTTRIVEVGKRKLRQISIYPLSFTDQATVASMLVQAITTVVTAWPNKQNVDIVNDAKELIINNIETILGKVVDTDTEPIKQLLEDTTNDQLMDIAGVIWEVNFEDPLEKKGKNLLEKMQKAFRLTTSLPQSQSDITSP